MTIERFAKFILIAYIHIYTHTYTTILLVVDERSNIFRCCSNNTRRSCRTQNLFVIRIFRCVLHSHEFVAMPRRTSNSNSLRKMVAFWYYINKSALIQTISLCRCSAQAKLAFPKKRVSVVVVDHLHTWRVCNANEFRIISKSAEAKFNLRLLFSTRLIAVHLSRRNTMKYSEYCTEWILT